MNTHTQTHAQTHTHAYILDSNVHASNRRMAAKKKAYDVRVLFDPVKLLAHLVETHHIITHFIDLSFEYEKQANQVCICVHVFTCTHA